MGKHKVLKIDSSEGYSFSEVLRLVDVALGNGVSVLLRGHPGVGKSALAGLVAKGLGLPLVDIRLAQGDPAELAGICFPDHARGVEAVCPAWVDEACSRPSLIFLDEINSAVTRLHQAAGYQIVLEKRIGQFVFHPGTKVMAAGTLETNSNTVTALSPVFCNRFMHVILAVNTRDWLQWAAKVGIAAEIVALSAVLETTRSTRTMATSPFRVLGPGRWPAVYFKADMQTYSGSWWRNVLGLRQLILCSTILLFIIRFTLTRLF